MSERIRSEQGASWLSLVVSIAICFAAAGLGSALTNPGLEPWYASIAKPWFNPPNWIFGPVWTLLFLAMAVSLWRLWRVSSPHQDHMVMRLRALALFALQLALNVAWSGAFFYLQSPLLGLVVIALFLLSLLACFTIFRHVDRIAAWLFVPYIAWVAFASVLNMAIVALN